MRLYHGTDVDSAMALLAGATLDAEAAARRHIDGELGFYLATSEGDAEFFAARRWKGAVVVIELSDDGMRRLEAAGAERHSIPGGRPPYFEGDEIWVPITAFVTFNQLIGRGEVVVGPSR